MLDVGANLGVFSRFLAKLVGPQGKVHAFEPIPQTYEFLCHNLKLMKLSQVEALPLALSDTPRTDIMVIPTYRWGSECWYDARIKTEEAKPGWREIRVESQTLDSFNLPKISFVKCDANYHELAVLRGGLETIRRSHPVMLIEVNPDPDDPTSTAFETFCSIGKGRLCAAHFSRWEDDASATRRAQPELLFYPQLAGMREGPRGTGGPLL